MASIDSTPGPQEPTWLGSMRNAHTRSRGAAIWTVPENCMDVSEEGRSRPGGGGGGGRGGGDVRPGLRDEGGAAAHPAEGVHDPVVLGEVAGAVPLDGHAAHRVEQDDVVRDGGEDGLVDERACRP